MFGQMRGSRRRRQHLSNWPSDDLGRDDGGRSTTILGIAIIILFILLSDLIVLPPVQHVNSAVGVKEYSPARRGHLSTGAPFKVSEKWRLSFNIQGKISRTEVSRELYNEVNINDVFRVEYTRSWLFRRVRIVSIQR